jgi:hypothetical protein
LDRVLPATWGHLPGHLSDEPLKKVRWRRRRAHALQFGFENFEKVVVSAHGL